jgi:hypothetical protein
MKKSQYSESKITAGALAGDSGFICGKHGAMYGYTFGCD